MVSLFKSLLPEQKTSLFFQLNNLALTIAHSVNSDDRLKHCAVSGFPAQGQSAVWCSPSVCASLQNGKGLYDSKPPRRGGAGAVIWVKVLTGAKGLREAHSPMNHSLRLSSSLRTPMIEFQSLSCLLLPLKVEPQLSTTQQ